MLAVEWSAPSRTQPSWLSSSSINGLSETNFSDFEVSPRSALGGSSAAPGSGQSLVPRLSRSLSPYPGIGPFSADSILLRGAGRSRLRAHRRAAPRSSDGDRLRPEGTPQRRRRRRDQRGLEALPRVGFALLLRTMLERQTHEIAGHAIPQTGRTADPVRSPKKAAARVRSPSSRMAPPAHQRSRSTLPAARQRRRGRPYHRSVRALLVVRR